MFIRKELYENYEFITIQNINFEVVLCDLGAAIFSIKLDGKLMSQSFIDKKDFFKSNNYHGKTIGRVCNRLPGNEVEINNKKYKILNNEGENTLHGGVDGISTKKFISEVVEKENETIVKYTFVSISGESGFPGELKLIVSYHITNENEVLIEFDATSDEDTMCSLTNHAYYCLGEDSLEKLELQIKSSKFLHPNPSDLLPLEIRDVDEIMDFRDYKIITKDIDDSYLVNSKTNGYDHYYYFDELNKKISQISLRSKSYQMDVFTDFSGTQIYSDNGFDEKPLFINSSLPRHRGIAIEPSESQKDLHFLNKNEKYYHYIKLAFKRR